MPFGSIFGAMFFGLFCSLLGVRLLVSPSMGARAAGVLVGLLGASLALGLLQRRGWARWLGALVAALAVAVAFRLVGSGGGVGDNVLLLSALLTTVLLVLPATGDPRRGQPGTSPSDRTMGALGWIAIASFAGSLALAMWTSAPTTEAVPSSGLPAAAIGRQIRWHDFGEGLNLARDEGKPILATFVTDWCPYCTKMGKKAWRSSSVLERMDDVVTVRVDAEEQTERNGFVGSELARRFGVQGYPAQLLLDADGRVLARYDGYQEPGQLLTWLDRELGPIRTTSASRGTAR